MPLIPFQDIHQALSGFSAQVAPQANLVRFRSISGDIKTIDISIDALADSDIIFNLVINGVSQFAGAARPKIAAGTSHGSKTGLTIAVSDDDLISFDCEDVGGGFSDPTYFRVTIDDGLAGGVSSIVAGSGVTVDSTDPANPIVSSSGGSGGGGLDYTVDKLEDFSGGGSVGSDFTVVGSGFSIVSGKGNFLPTANDGFGASYPRITLAANQSMVNKCLIIDIDSKPGLGTVGNSSLGFSIVYSGADAYYYWDLNDTNLHGGVGATAIGNFAIPTFPAHRILLRLRVMSNGTGSNTHIIYFEYSFDGILWNMWDTTKQVTKTSLDLDSVNITVNAASYSGTAPGNSVINRIIIGDMIVQ